MCILRNPGYGVETVQDNSWLLWAGPIVDGDPVQDSTGKHEEQESDQELHHLINADLRAIGKLLGQKIGENDKTGSKTQPPFDNRYQPEGF
jgi:hypothetical protein